MAKMEKYEVDKNVLGVRRNDTRTNDTEEVRKTTLVEIGDDEKRVSLHLQ